MRGDTQHRRDGTGRRELLKMFDDPVAGASNADGPHRKLVLSSDDNLDDVKRHRDTSDKRKAGGKDAVDGGESPEFKYRSRGGRGGVGGDNDDEGVDRMRVDGGRRRGNGADSLQELLKNTKFENTANHNY